MSKRRAEKSKWSMQSEAIRNHVLLSMFAAIIILLNFTPIGFLNLGFIKATIIHIPVIIGAVLLGPKRGAVLGLLFGACSLVVNTVTPSLLSFAFSPMIPVPGIGRGSVWALVICFIPRLLVGVLPHYFYQLIRFFVKHETTHFRTITLAVTGVLGSFINTGFVMSLIYFVFKDAYASVKNIPVTAVVGAIMGVVGVNGVPEALAAAVLTAAVCYPLQKVMKLDPLKVGKGKPLPEGVGKAEPFDPEAFSKSPTLEGIEASDAPSGSPRRVSVRRQRDNLSQEAREALSSFENRTPPFEEDSDEKKADS